jgi:hypothetical protein
MARGLGVNFISILLSVGPMIQAKAYGFARLINALMSRVEICQNNATKK